MTEYNLVLTAEELRHLRDAMEAAARDIRDWPRSVSLYNQFLTLLERVNIGLEAVERG